MVEINTYTRSIVKLVRDNSEGTFRDKNSLVKGLRSHFIAKRAEMVGEVEHHSTGLNRGNYMGDIGLRVANIAINSAYAHKLIEGGQTKYKEDDSYSYSPGPVRITQKGMELFPRK